MALDTLRALGADLERIREEKGHLERLTKDYSPALVQELRRWERREAEVLNSIASEEALLEGITKVTSGNNTTQK